MSMILAEWIIEQLSQLGCNHIFLVPGEEIDPLVATLGAQSTIKTIVTNHEEGAGFMADGYARIRNELGVCLSVSTTGATNLVPALLAASADRSKVLCLTGSSDTTSTDKADGNIDGM